MKNMISYTLRLKPYTPETLPMRRLGEYLSALADLVGRNAVRFDRVIKGSAQLKVIATNDTALIEARVSGAPFADESSEERRGYERINGLLREDNARADFRQYGMRKNAIILSFPGNKNSFSVFSPVREYCEVNGRIIRIGGKDETIPVSLMTPYGETIACTANREIAKKLKEYLLEPIDVILCGNGKFTRDTNGKWILSEFRVNEFRSLSYDGLENELAELRKSGSGWDIEDAPEAALLALRDGA